MIDLISSAIDASDCLNNCSQNGVCAYSQSLNKFICSCNSFFAGTQCEKDTRPCSLNHCFNNGTCIQNLTDPSSPSYYCSCSKYYTGSLCETKIDICQNESCSGQGKCYDLNNEPVCKCYNSYFGNKCEKMSETLVTTKKIISTASYIAMSLIISFYLTIVSMDLLRIFIIKQKSSIKVQKWNTRIHKEIIAKKKKSKIRFQIQFK